MTGFIIYGVALLILLLLIFLNILDIRSLKDKNKELEERIDIIQTKISEKVGNNQSVKSEEKTEEPEEEIVDEQSVYSLVDDILSGKIEIGDK